MSALWFECPATGHHVATGIDIDPDSFASLPKLATQVTCPHCPEPPVSALRPWRHPLKRLKLQSCLAELSLSPGMVSIKWNRQSHPKAAFTKFPFNASTPCCQRGVY
jgi:hypothetical protein